MAYLPAWLVLSLLPIRPQVGSTNTGMGNANHGVSWRENGRIRDLLNLYIKCSTKNCCMHCLLLLLLIPTSNVTIQVLDSSPPAAARVFLCCGHGSRRPPCPQHKNPLRTTVECRAILPGGQVMRARVVRSPEQLRLKN